MAYRQATVNAQRRPQPYPKRQPCPVSRVYDEAHAMAQEEGKYCLNSHSMFHWQGLEDNRVTLISDSILKWVHSVVHLQVQAISGLTLSRALEKLSTGEIKCTGFNGIIFHVSTNDFENGCKNEIPITEITRTIVYKTLEIITFLKAVAPGTKIAISMILPRPKDKTIVLDQDRMTVNMALKSMCKKQKVGFLNTFKGVALGDSIHTDPLCFGDDGLHLSMRGVVGVKRFLKGAVGALLRGTKKEDLA
jgi:lysophospholipase L1-like esterase